MPNPLDDLFSDFFGGFDPLHNTLGLTSRPLPSTPRAQALAPTIVALEKCMALTRDARDAYRRRLTK